MIAHHGGFILKTLTAILMLLVTLAWTAANGPALESYFLPARTTFKLKSIERVGNDVVLTGTVYVNRQCEFLPPPQAKILADGPLLASSLSPYQKQVWLAGQTYRVGPWLIKDGAGQMIQISQNHRCHKFWVTVSDLGVIDATKLVGGAE